METQQETLVTKEYLDVKLKAELQQLRADILDQLISAQRWNIGLIFGLYAILIVGHFIK